jgi:hypothetical protein
MGDGRWEPRNHHNYELLVVIAHSGCVYSAFRGASATSFTDRNQKAEFVKIL